MIGVQPPTRRRDRHTLGLVVLFLLVAGVALIRATVAFPVRIDSASMMPTFSAGDVVLVSRTPPQLDDLHHGDLVVFVSPQDGQRTLKRVVGLPGDVLVILDSRLHVNDTVVKEPYVDHAMIDGYYSETFRVPDRSVFVLGDNRGNSVDSRDYGPVALDELVGRVVVRVWPVAPLSLATASSRTAATAAAPTIAPASR